MGTKYSLESVRIERRSLSASYPFVCVLPPPPSVNELFGQAPGRKRFRTAKYNDWIEEAGLRLNAARPPKFKGQVWISIVYSDQGRGDIDNKAKACLDLLVSHGVIEDDSRPHVRELRLSWGNNAGARIEVRPFPFTEGKAA